MKAKTRAFLKEYLLTAIFAVTVAFLIRAYGIEAYRIPSLAMSPTLIPGDTIFVEKWSFLLKGNPPPKRGDVVVFSGVPISGTENFEYIRRVIGLPGDQVQIENGIVILNGKLLGKQKPSGLPSFLREELSDQVSYSIQLAPPLIEDVPMTSVPEGSIFVIGDYRGKAASLHSKNWGLIPISALRGKALYVWLSLDPTDPTTQNFNWLPQFRLNRMFKRIL